MTNLSFWGASGEVTGSCFLLTEGKSQVLVDCGLFQGAGDAEIKNRQEFGFDPKLLSAVVLTHAHLDHCGRLPLLAKAGFSGSVWATAPSADFLPLVLFDAAKVSGLGGLPAVYSDYDVERILRQVKTVEYHSWHDIAPGFAARWWDAGHMLGSSSIEIRLPSNETILFSGDLGNVPSPIVRVTDQPEAVDYVVMESTYGDRLHPPRGEELRIVEQLCNRIGENNGTLLIPAFSLERTQEFLHIFDHLKSSGKVDRRLPVYLDSPMALKATAVFEHYPQYFNDHLKAQFGSDDPFDFPGLITVEKGHESRRLTKIQRSKVIIAGSGMMSGGRVVNHAKKLLADKRAIVLINGYQAQGTLGRAVLERAEQVVVEGVTLPLKASVVEITSMSGHADQNQLLSWANKMTGIKKIFLVHGEKEARETLSTKLTAPEKILPLEGATYEL